MTCASEKDLARFVSGGVEPEMAASIREHLARCPSCHDRYVALAAITGRLAADPGEFDMPDFVGDVMTSIRANAAVGENCSTDGRVSRRRAGARGGGRLQTWLLHPEGRRSPLLAISVAIAAAAAVVLFWVHSERSLWTFHDVPTGFQPRGSMSANPDRWVSVDVFRDVAGGYQRVADRIASRDALAFAYSNAGDEGYRYLMILAVDHRGRPFWYYPARESDAADPSSIAIQQTPHADLPDQVRHDLEPGSLRILAIFSKQPLRVSEVERALRGEFAAVRSVERLAHLRLEGTGQHALLVEVRSPADAEAE